MRAARAALLVAVLAGLVGACSSGPSSATGTAATGGYVSSDGSVRTWPAGRRTGPVLLAGTDFAGRRQDVTAWRGDVVVLNTWYAGCPPCRAEAATLAALATDDASRGLHVLGINGVDDAGTAQAFERRFGIGYPSIADTDGTAVAALQGVVPVNATPTTVVLDRTGRVYARILGEADASTLTALVDDVLGDASAAPTATGTP